MPLRPLRILLLALLFLLPRSGHTDESFPGADWDQLPPGTGGWSVATLAKAQAWSNQIGATAVMIVQHGLVVAQWGDVAAKTPLASVRKSLLSALIGIAAPHDPNVLDKTLGALGIDDNEPSLTAQEKTATMRDLLQARSGVYHHALCEAPGMATARPARFSHAPGTFWYYNNWDFNALGAIYLHATGVSIFDAFNRQIARPIGMQDYQPADGQYVTGAASVYPCYMFHMSARDLARFALLYLNDGKWRDNQIVPEQWVKDSTRSYSQTGFGGGYGYLWWTGPIDNSSVPIVNLPPGTFFAWGYAGQFAFVMPADDLVVVIRNAHYLEPGPSFREIGRLLWLVLDAGGFSGIGPDASIEAAHGTPQDAAALSHLLPGKTLLFGDAALGGPFRMRIGSDGTTALFKGESTVAYDTGTWTIAENKLCRDWQKITPHHACFTTIHDGATVRFFDRNGLMVLEAQVTE
jgi:CubicO group peptidase (beta-lactamase class C family)